MEKCYTITVRFMDAQTKEVTLTARMKTKKITKERAIELAKQEVKNAISPACWEIK